MCQIKFILTGQAPKLTGKCLVTGCYYKHCNIVLSQLQIGDGQAVNFTNNNLQD